ncbi:DUF3604 domain-containing protein [Microbulbifer sp. Q7]|uniref:DUF3604 domain-containing protein n=1 Tax=Microbulbifer sp. Q7 TaxID=1785091 RepID=UPI000AB033EA|nr:DUF3604 domain-containing protein [Microbulbifer sp. Q7]
MAFRLGWSQLANGLFRFGAWSVACAMLGLATSAVAQESEKSLSDIEKPFPSQVFFGDTHLHTDISVDAGTMNRLGQEAAFRFARGEEVKTTHGLKAKLRRPLDFLVIADHAEMYGLMPRLLAGDKEILATEKGQRWYEMLRGGDRESTFKAAMEIVASLQEKEPPFSSEKIVRDSWHAYTALADQYNQPGKFTAIIGYEWTAIGGYNLHRNVLFRGGASSANNTVPFSQFDSQNPEDLWRALAAFERKHGERVIAIPHNGNLSNGRMFTVENFDGSPLSRQMAELRARFEPIVEVTQIKGDGEAHPMLSPGDEFAGYEIWDAANLDGTERKKPEMLRWEYAREALKTGLMLDKTLGVNPYKFGMIGSTDAHTSLAAVEEDNFFGKHSGVEPEPGRWEHMVIEAPDPELTIYGWQMASSGYAAVWAEENTREALFDAMVRKETYATTGSRMVVRFFGGWDFTSADADKGSIAERGYTKGVPMGADLPKASAQGAPSFLVAAMKDPIGGNLDRIQIVKGWQDKNGVLKEKVYDVVWSGKRKPSRDGRIPAVGNTVDVANATWQNTIGEKELRAVWRDPEFDPAEMAFYYARVIEIPTPRWTAYEAKRFGVKMGKDVPMVTTERAYTSPIWYSPIR